MVASSATPALSGCGNSEGWCRTANASCAYKVNTISGLGAHQCEDLTITASTSGPESLPCVHSLPATFAPPPSTRPFLIASFPTLIKPRMAPSRVPLLFPTEMSASNKVFMIRGDKEGYVVECCVSSRESVCDADMRRWVEWLGGRVECKRVDKMEGRI